MSNNFTKQIIDFVVSVVRLIWRSTVARFILGALTALTALQNLGILSRLLSSLTAAIGASLSWLSLLHFGVPLYIWLAIGLTLSVLSYYVRSLSRYLNLVAGEFKDNFREGLGKWDYDGEGWTTEKEGEEPVLSVMNSADGGITQTGFWDCFSFTFENKLLGRGKIGWLVKARDRSNYLMLQFVILESDGTNSESGLKAGVYIRPHFRLEGSWIIWPHEQLTLSEKLQKLIRRYSWFRVEVRVRGNTIDIYLENEHVYHFYVDDPLRVEKTENSVYQNEQGQTFGGITFKKLNVFSYSQGRVGFRCAPTEEHAHIRNVRIRPIW